MGKSKYYVRPDGLHEAIRVINGKRKAFRGKTDREVDRKILEFREEEEKGPLFLAVAKEWHDEHWKEISPQTKRGYDAAYSAVISAFDARRIKEITPAMVSQFVKAQVRLGFARDTVDRRLYIAGMICNHAILGGILDINPCAAVRLPGGLKKEKRGLPSDRDLKAVEDGVDGPDGLLPFFLLYSGLRRGEALALRYGDIDRKEKVIRVTKSVYYDPLPKIKEPKTKAGIRSVVFLDKLAAVLPDGPEDELVFPGRNGGLMTKGTFAALWERWKKASGANVCAHQLRHGFATLCLEAGLDEKDAQEQLGHASAAVTRDVYEHIRASRRKLSAEKLNAAAEKFTASTQ